MSRDFVVIDPRDNVATAVRALSEGEVLVVDTRAPPSRVTLSEAIPFGHKFAMRLISAGSPIVKYGETVGLATTQIDAGMHVHVHNVEGRKGRGDKLRSADVPVEDRPT